ncbi:MAG: cell division protein FtsA [Candidatus Pacebacteria bacterium]|nr:cell division protein FtsA [Candidatus Paceibacterota bacterium]
MAKHKRDILTGVEIGSSAVKVVMGEFLPDDVLSIVGVGERPALKVIKGDVSDVNIVQEQLMQALAEAEKASGLDIGHVFLAVSGGSVRSVNSVGSTVIHSMDRKVRETDVMTGLRNAKSYALPPDKRILHHLDRRYVADGDREVLNPVGLVAGRLEAEIQIIYGQHNTVETSCRTLADAMGYPATDIAFSGVADGFALFSPEEMEQGAMVLDIGAGVTEYVVFFGPGAYHSGQVTVGCEHISNDLSLGLRLPLPKCRKLLHELGTFGASAAMTPDGRSRLVEVETLGKGGRRIPVSSVEQIIELRLHELFSVILADLRKADALPRIAAGIVLAGGGAMIPGVIQLAHQVFNMPVRTGRPRLVSGVQDVSDSPRYVTPVGLLRWGRLSLEIADSEPAFMEQVREDFSKVWGLVTRAFRW